MGTLTRVARARLTKCRHCAAQYRACPHCTDGQSQYCWTCSGSGIYVEDHRNVPHPQG
jgi:hypothetical protein